MMAYNDLIETKEGITQGEIRDRIMVDAFFLQALQFMKNITQEELQKNGYYLIKTYEATTHGYEISSFRLKTCPEDHEILYGKSEKGLGQYRVIPSPESNLITERESRVLSENFNYRRKSSILNTLSNILYEVYQGNLLPDKTPEEPKVKKLGS